MITIETLQQYINEGKTSKEIADLFNCHFSTVRRFAKKNNIQWKSEQPKKTEGFIGFKSGKLTVIAFYGYQRKGTKQRRRPFWLCQCECGNSKVVDNSNLLSGNIQSCGCLHKERIKELHKKTVKPDAPFYSLLKEYQRGAKDRGFSWELTEEQFRNITSSNCYYCNEEPSKIRDSNGGIKYKGIPYKYNGIDRVDNRLGYTIQNTVPCCWMCNMLKGSFGKDEFINKLKQIYEFRTRDI